jgi:UDP-arabinose 4-epimerase
MLVVAQARMTPPCVHLDDVRVEIDRGVGEHVDSVQASTNRTRRAVVAGPFRASNQALDSRTKRRSDDAGARSEAGTGRPRRLSVAAGQGIGTGCHWAAPTARDRRATHQDRSSRIDPEHCKWASGNNPIPRDRGLIRRQDDVGLRRRSQRSARWRDSFPGKASSAAQDRALLRDTLFRHRPTAVIHLAAFAYVAESVEDPALYYNNNVGGTVELVEAMRDCSVRHIVLSSSCAVYGVPQSVPIGETSPLDPISPYGASKMMCEQLLRDWSDAFPLDWMALRYFNAAGADPEGEIGECHVPETHAIPLILKAAREGTAFTIYGDDYPTGDQSCVRDYTHVTDLACAHVIALHKLLEGMESAAINIGTGRGSSVRELIEIARQVTGRDIPVRISQRRTGDPPALVSDPARARTLLGWSPRYPDLAQQISHAWAWHQGGLRTWRRFQKAHLA